MFPDNLNPLFSYSLSRDQINYLSEFDLDTNLNQQDLDFFFNDFISKIISHPNCPFHLFNDLKNSSNLLILELIAANHNTPLLILKEFLNNDEEDEYIKFKAASNPSLPIDYLITLSTSLNDSIVDGVAANPTTPSFVLESLINPNINLDRIDYLIDNPSSSNDVFQKLISLNNSKINTILSNNPNTPSDILKLI